MTPRKKQGRHDSDTEIILKKLRLKRLGKNNPMTSVKVKTKSVTVGKRGLMLFNLVQRKQKKRKLRKFKKKFTLRKILPKFAQGMWKNGLRRQEDRNLRTKSYLCPDP